MFYCSYLVVYLVRFVIDATTNPTAPPYINYHNGQTQLKYRQYVIDFDYFKAKTKFIVG